MKNFNNAISRHFEIKRKRPDDGSGSVTTMIIGCRFLESENGEAVENSQVTGSSAMLTDKPPLLQD